MRYTVTEHTNTFNNRKWYSLQDHETDTDVELDNRTWDYAQEVCRKFNREDKAGLHDNDLIMINGSYVHMVE